MDEPIYCDVSKSPIWKPRDLYEILEDAVHNDEINDFFRLIKDPVFKDELRFITANKIFRADALKIGIAVLNGEIKGIIELEDVLKDGMTPLHLAAAHGALRLTKYLLERGDNVDVLCDFGRLNLKQATPIDLALGATERTFWNFYEYEPEPSWTTRNSVIELLAYVCETRRPFLEIVRMLVQNTQNKERIRKTFIDFAHEGRLVQFAALFLAAPEVFLSSSIFLSPGGGLSSFSKYLEFNFLKKRTDSEEGLSGSSSFNKLYLELNSLKKRTDIEKGLSLLLDVFAMVGHKLVAYIRVEDPRVLGFCCSVKKCIVPSLLREVAQKKLGVSSADEYFLSLCKPVRQVGPNPRLPKRFYDVDFSRSVFPYCMMRSGFTKIDDLTYINCVLPSLKHEDAALLNKAIESKLSSMSTMHDIFKNVAKISNKGEEHHKHLPQGLLSHFSGKIELPVPFPIHLNIYPKGSISLQPFSTSAAIAKSTNSLENKVIKPTELTPFFSLVKLSHFPMIVKRLIKW